LDYFQPKYVLQKGGAGHSAFSFNKVIEKIGKSSESKVTLTIVSSGKLLRTPVSGNWVKTGFRSKRTSLGHLAKKMARKTSLLNPQRKFTPTKDNNGRYTQL
jgi:hypothetical protein